ncbi:hypothetical protein BGZ63DRAFT_371804 [Mariannaea sp. PMI_226]|nr:hypothetical protein BGZ63DRAFT_371804 [Mariannaea sp. PMI_226]
MIDPSCWSNGTPPHPIQVPQLRKSRRQHRLLRPAYYLRTIASHACNHKAPPCHSTQDMPVLVLQPSTFDTSRSRSLWVVVPDTPKLFARLTARNSPFLMQPYDLECRLWRCVTSPQTSPGSNSIICLEAQASYSIFSVSLTLLFGGSQTRYLASCMDICLYMEMAGSTCLCSFPCH